MILDKYLETLQEEFVPSVAKASVAGSYNEDWTRCYTTRCERLTDDLEIKECKLQCYIDAATRAIAELNRLKGECRDSNNPDSCIETLDKAIERYNKKITSSRQAQTEVRAKITAQR